MDSNPKEKDAQALRYRLHVRLGLVLQAAEAQNAVDLKAQAESLRQRLAAIDVRASPQDAQVALTELRADVIVLQRRAGVAEYGLTLFPKWMKLLLGALPVIVAFLTIGFILERRRRKKAVSEEALRQLEDPGESSSGLFRRSSSR